MDAIGRDVTSFFEHALPRVLKGAIEVRRSRLEARRAVEENLTWGPEWKAATPRLVDVDPVEEEEAPLGLPTVTRRRLDPAAFTDVVTSIRLWADSMERHPRVWSRLEEEDICDLLVATLIAALPGAQREVYSRSGKSDIFITADVLAAGAGPAKVFICENKIWDGPIKAGAALDQLLGYLEVKDTAAVLLFFRKTGRGPAVRKALREALTVRDDHVGSGPDLGGWPVEKFRNGDGAIVDVCLAVVDLPRT